MYIISEKTISVLILVLVEDTRGEPNVDYKLAHYQVLILVLVEDTRGEPNVDYKLAHYQVLILVLVEDTRGGRQCIFSR